MAPFSNADIVILACGKRHRIRGRFCFSLSDIAVRMRVDLVAPGIGILGNRGAGCGRQERHGEQQKDAVGWFHGLILGLRM